MGETLMAPEETSRVTGGLSRSTLRRLVEAGEFPKPVVLSRTRSGHPARIAWRSTEVAAWIARKVAGASASGPEAA